MKSLNFLIKVLRKIVAETDYKGEHMAPTKDDGAPMHDLKNIYPEDIYSLDARNLYSSGHLCDGEAISIIQSTRDKPNTSVKIYRAIPKVLSNDERIAELEKHKAYILKTGKIPNGVDGWVDKSKYYDFCCDELERLKSNPGTPTKKLTINKGDWVAICKGYAVDHGKDHLNNKYRILSKTVKAKNLYTDGNSIQEWGYDPQ